MKVPDEQFVKIQVEEFRWWAYEAEKKDGYDPTQAWKHYDPIFQPFLRPFARVADVGCGPIPYFLNPIVEYDFGAAIDPLFDWYMKVNRYQKYLERVDQHFLDIEKVCSDFYDGVFSHNTIDHVQDPYEHLKQLHRITSENGRFYLYVDVDKPIDVMHPHTIKSEELVSALGFYFQEVFCKKEKSWKWNSPILWFVGEKFEQV